MKKEEAYEKLRVKIVTNRITPGEILNEKELMAEYTIGRSPLREVLFRLQEENMLKPLPRLGYMVTTLVISEVSDLVELRRELEGFAGYLAAQRITPQQLNALKAIISEAENAPPKKQAISNITEYYDTRIHEVLCEAAGNQKLTKVLQGLHITMLRIWFQMGLNVIGFDYGAQNLYVLLEALEQKDSEKARAAMEAHVDSYATQVKDKFL